MDSLNSFKGYGKVDPVEEQSFRRKTRSRIIIISLSSILLLALLIGAIAGTIIHHRKTSSTTAPPANSSLTAAIKAMCGITQYPDSCSSTLLSLNTTTADPKQLFILSLHVALNELTHVASFPPKLVSKTNDEDVKSALAVCQAVIADSADHLEDSISAVDGSTEKIVSMAEINNLRTWLSTSLTDYETCLDALREVNSTASRLALEEVTGIMKNSTEFASNSLAIVTKVLGVMVKILGHRKLLEEEDSMFPSWMRASDRRLLKSEDMLVEPNVTVAKDDSGDVKTINEALALVPMKSEMRFVIYVKAGVYKEYVNMSNSFHNVMMFGDGMNESIITYNHYNGSHNMSTFNSATFTVTGKNFIAKNMGFRNTAGPEKGPAVALRSGSDQSVFYRCSFNAFQDTLYPHSNRQFYHECDIIGTVDFIFGNAAVVFENCSIKPRQPLPKQFVAITAQGKTDPNQNTGISIHKCVMLPFDNLTADTYLGRPWKNYSTTVIMQTNIGSFLNPAGWASWDGKKDPPSTIFYAEYENDGPGANLSRRVTWPGYKRSIPTGQALKFLDIIGSADWPAEMGVKFESSLT